MKKIHIVSSLFYPLENANSYVITNKAIELSKKFSVSVSTFQTIDDSNNEIKNLVVNRNAKFKKLLLLQNSFKRCDLLLSYHHGYETAYIALFNKILLRKKWIVILSDPAPHISPFPNNYTPIQELLLSKIPMSIIARFSDCVIFNDKYQADYIKQYYRFKDYRINQMGYTNTLNFNSKKDNIVFGCFGDLYGPRNGMELFEVISNNFEYFKQKQIQFIFYGNYEMDPTEYFSFFPQIEGIVFFNDRVSKEEVPNKISNCSILLVVDGNLGYKTDIYPYTPSKIIDYIGTNKPIFGISMEKSPTRDICLNSLNWWSDFNQQSIFENLKDCIENYSSYTRNTVYCESFSIENKNRELIEIILEFISGGKNE